MFHENANHRVQDDIEKEEVPIHFPFFSHFPDDPEDDQVENHFIDLGGVKGLSREHLSCRAVRRVDHAPRQAGRIAMGVSVEKAAHSADSLDCISKLKTLGMLAEYNQLMLEFSAKVTSSQFNVKQNAEYLDNIWKLSVDQGVNLHIPGECTNAKFKA